MRGFLSVVVSGFVGITACSSVSSLPGPADAPEPTAPNQVLVDKDGCTWWVIGNATSYEWSPRIDPEGNHICDRNVDGLTSRDLVRLGNPGPTTAGRIATLDNPTPAPLATIESATVPEVAPVAAAPVAVAPASPAPTPTPTPAVAPAAAPSAALPTPTPPSEPATVPSAGQGNHFVQVASFGQVANARTSSSLFRSLGYSVGPEAEQRNNAGLYLLVLGPFPTQAAAEAAQQSALVEGFNDAFTFTR